MITEAVEANDDGGGEKEGSDTDENKPGAPVEGADELVPWGLYSTWLAWADDDDAVVDDGGAGLVVALAVWSFEQEAGYGEAVLKVCLFLGKADELVKGAVVCVTGPHAEVGA